MRDSPFAGPVVLCWLQVDLSEDVICVDYPALQAQSKVVDQAMPLHLVGEKVKPTTSGNFISCSYLYQFHCAVSWGSDIEFSVPVTIYMNVYTHSFTRAIRVAAAMSTLHGRGWDGMGGMAFQLHFHCADSPLCLSSTCLTMFRPIRPQPPPPLLLVPAPSPSPAMLMSPSQPMQPAPVFVQSAPQAVYVQA